jgi:hypothetical protein
MNRVFRGGDVRGRGCPVCGTERSQCPAGGHYQNLQKMVLLTWCLESNTALCSSQFLLVEFMDVLMDFMGYLLTKAEGDLDFANDPTGREMSDNLYLLSIFGRH